MAAQRKLLEQAGVTAAAAASSPIGAACHAGGPPGGVHHADVVAAGSREPHPQFQFAGSAAAGAPLPPASPLQLRIGDATITPVGFMDMTSVTRSTNEGTGIGS